MKTLSGLTAALLLSAYCCTALASGADEANREFIRQQESFSQQLRGQDNAPLRQILEQQVRQNLFQQTTRDLLGLQTSRIR